MNSKNNNIGNFKFNSELAEICGIHAGDGYLRNDGKRRELDISGNVEEKEYYNSYVIPLFNKFFKVDIKGRSFPHRNTYGFIIRDRKVIEFMNSLEFPYGKKSLIVKIPKFILKNQDLKIAFLRGYFDTDGCLHFGKRQGLNYSHFKRTRHYYPRLMFSTVSKTLSKDLAKIFTEMNFKFVFYTFKSKSEAENLRYRFDINGILNLNKWVALVGIKNPVKMSRFLIWKNHDFCPANITYSERLKILKGVIDPNLRYKGL